MSFGKKVSGIFEKVSEFLEIDSENLWGIGGGMGESFCCCKNLEMS